jgi:SNF2 family DNA or RNA helicase
MLWETARRKTAPHRGEFSRLLAHQGLAVLAMTYDAFRVDDAAKSAKQLMTRRTCLYVADETTNIANPSAKITRRVLASAPLAPYRRALNGTPVSDSPFRAYSQIRFVDPDVWAAMGFKRYEHFKGYFGEWGKGFAAGGRTFPKLLGHRNLDKLSEILASTGSRVAKADVLDLPPKVYVRRYFDLGAKTAKAYSDLRTQLSLEVQGMTLTVDGALSLLTRLQQCASGRLPSDEDTTPVSICDERPRLELLREVLEEYNVPSAQAIIWARFTFEVDEICEMLTKLKIPFGRYDGEVTPDDRALAKERFQSGEYRVLVAKVQAAGVGLTLTAASLLVYYSNLFALSLREQSEDRAHRKGQEQTVTIVDLVAVGTVDERILEVLLTKRAVSEQVTDPKWWLASS